MQLNCLLCRKFELKKHLEQTLLESLSAIILGLR
jgi:hypothetical protein